MQRGSPRIYDNSFEIHDKEALAHARALLDAAADAEAMGRDAGHELKRRGGPGFLST